MPHRALARHDRPDPLRRRLHRCRSESPPSPPSPTANFGLVPQITRILEINNITTISRDLVETARDQPALALVQVGPERAELAGEILFRGHSRIIRSKSRTPRLFRPKP